MSGDKTAILDIRARSEDGRVLNVEMQVVNSSNFIHRTLYYWSELYGECLHAGDDYLTLNRTITINILNFRLFPRERLMSLYQLRDSEDQALLTDLMQIYFIELPKLNKQSIPPRLQQWLRFITIDDNDELKALAKANPAIGEAYTMLSYISQDSEERMRHVRRKIALMDQKALERDAKEAQARLEAAEKELKDAEQRLKSAEQQYLSVEQQRQSIDSQRQAAEEQRKFAEEQRQAAEEERQAAEARALQAEILASQRIEKARAALLSVTQTLLSQRFGALPQWAKERLASATLEQLEAISEKASTSANLEHCLH